MSARGPLAAVALLGLVASLAALVAWPGADAPAQPLTGARPPAPIAAAPAPGKAPPRDGPARASVLREALFPTAVLPPATTAAPSLAAPGEDAIAAYARDAVFPPSSRPLLASRTDKLHPNRRYEAPRATAGDDGATYLFTADRYFLTGRDELHATLEVTRAGAPAGATLLDARAEVAGGVTASISFAERGHAWEASIAPASFAPADRASFVDVVVRFDAGHASAEEASIRVHFTPEGAIPARFTGRFDDAVTDGSLVIHAGVDVIAEGLYAIDANLHDAAGAPVAWARFKGSLDAGATRVPLVFFGKAIVDASPEPPFRLGELRGARVADGEDPDLEAMPPFEGPPYVTRTASLEGLSDAPWDAPAKHAKLRALRSALARPGAPRVMAASLPER